MSVTVAVVVRAVCRVAECLGVGSSAGHQPQEGFPVRRDLQVESDAAFVGVEMDKREATVQIGDIPRERRLLAGRATVGWLDSNHVGTEVGEKAGGVLTHSLRQIEYPEGPEGSLIG